MDLFEAFVDELEKTAKKKKEEGRGVLPYAGAGLMAGGVGMGGYGVAKALKGFRDNKASFEELKKIMRAYPKEKRLESQKHVQEFVRRKMPNAEVTHINTESPFTAMSLRAQGVEPDIMYGAMPGKKLLAPSAGPKAVLEHEGGHIIRRHVEDSKQNVRRMQGQTTGLGYRKNILKPELEAWREATRGAERRLFRRPALKSYKSMGHILRGRNIAAAAFLPLGLGALALLHKKEKA